MLQLSFLHSWRDLQNQALQTHTDQPRTLPLGDIVPHISFHLAVSPQWNCHCERLYYSRVCVVIFPQEWVCFCPWLIFSFSFSSFCLPPYWYQPGLFCLYLFFYFRELFREDAVHRMHTPNKLSTAWWDVLPEKRCCLLSFASGSNKRRAFFLLNFFVRGGFQAMNKMFLCVSWQV